MDSTIAHFRGTPRFSAAARPQSTTRPVSFGPRPVIALNYAVTSRGHVISSNSLPKSSRNGLRIGGAHRVDLLRTSERGISPCFAVHGGNDDVECFSAESLRDVSHFGASTSGPVEEIAEPSPNVSDVYADPMRWTSEFEVEESAGGVATKAHPGTCSGDVDHLQELINIQKSGPSKIGVFGTRNMGFGTQKVVETLAYALCVADNHIVTGGAAGCNAAVIRGALRANKPHLVSVVLPQSKSKTPEEYRNLLSQLKEENVIEMPGHDHLPLSEASQLSNEDIITRVQQVICFAFHDSRVLLECARLAQKMRKIVTTLYLD